MVESSVGSGIGRVLEGGGFPEDAGGLAIDCWLQQAYQVSNLLTVLLMRRRVSVALHARLLNNRGACAGACVWARCADENDVGVVVGQSCHLLSSLPSLIPTATNVNRAEPRYLLTTAPALLTTTKPTSHASLSLQPQARVSSLSVAEACPTNIVRSIVVS